MRDSAEPVFLGVAEPVLLRRAASARRAWASLVFSRSAGFSVMPAEDRPAEAMTCGWSLA
jgi:hypothetical protein